MKRSEEIKKKNKARPNIKLNGHVMGLCSFYQGNERGRLISEISASTDNANGKRINKLLMIKVKQNNNSAENQAQAKPGLLVLLTITCAPQSAKQPNCSSLPLPQFPFSINQVITALLWCLRAPWLPETHSIDHVWLVQHAPADQYILSVGD